MIVSFKSIWRRVLPPYIKPLFIIFCVAVLVTSARWYFGREWLAITTTPLTVVGATLGILLGFRSNEAYNRYWEARTLWGALVNWSRTFTRLVTTLIPPPYIIEDNDREDVMLPEHTAFHREMVLRQIAFVYALKNHLRQADDMFTEIAPFLDATELAALKNERNVPAAILHRAGERVREAWRRGWLQEFHVANLQEALSELTNVQGGCERIKNTPIPRGYTYLTSKIVMVFCLALPFGLVDTLKAATPIVATMVAFTYLILDRFGRVLEDPFSTDYNSLPLNALARTIEVNLRQRIGDKDLPPDVKPVDEVLM